MHKNATVTVHPAYPIGTISPRLFGAFLEPIGTMVNGSMYNPHHPAADELGLRQDFMQALKAAGLPAIRLPGGNYVSGWDWADSIGPRAQRKAHLDLAWHQYITNEVGHDEYLQWAERIGTEPMYTINLGTGTIRDAIRIIEYTNHAGGTYWSDLRAQNGHAAPYGVKLWYLGNEVDGPWQIASWEKDPRGYGVLANETSKAMKWVDPHIETAACVSSTPFIPHYPEWDREALEQCYESVDYISMHHYHAAPKENMAAVMGGSCYFEDYINTEIALCDFLQTKLRSPRKMLLSVDEYATIVTPQKPLHPGGGVHNLYAAHYRFDPDAGYVRHDPDHMEGKGGMQHLMPQMTEALTSASTLLAFLRHADRVKIGCMTNGIFQLAATDRAHVWKPAGYYPYAQLIRYARGTSLRTAVDCDRFDIPGYAMDDNSAYADHFGIPYLDTAAAFDAATGELNLFVLNRSWTDDSEVTLDVRGFAGARFVEQLELYSEDPDAANSYEHPDRIVPAVCAAADFAGGCVHSRVRKMSWNVFRFIV